MNDFLVVGAGLAGLACARDLKAAGASVAILDKGRGPGGRCATRRLGDLRIDHGAQFFTARSERFREITDRGVAEGWIREWFRSIPLWQNGEIIPRPEGHPRYACPHGNSALPKFLAQDMEVNLGDAVVQINRTDGGYVATMASGAFSAGRKLVLNLPPEQLLALASHLLAPEDSLRIASVTMEPRWAVIAALTEDVSVGWPALELSGHPALSWISRDHTKRGAGAPPALVVHADADWTRAHIDDSPDAVISALLHGVEEIVGPMKTISSQAHRWRYAKTTTPLGAPHFLRGDIGACGDWCVGGRVEGAIESGWALAAQILPELPGENEV